MLPVVLLFAAVVHWPPPTPDAKPAGCKIQDSLVAGQPKVWLVDVFLQYPDGTQKAYLFSRREANQRKKAMLDCNDFMEHYEKQAKKEPK